MQLEPINKKRIIIFLLFTFGISWLCALIIALTGGLNNSPAISTGSPITLAYVLLISVYMWGPALGNLFTRLITREGRQDLYLQLNLKKYWRYWLISWFAPGIFIILGAVVFFVFFPQYFGSGFESLRAQMSLVGQDPNSVNLPQLILTQTFFAMLIAPILNALPTFGEEFGWRGYLLPKLQVLGYKKSLILSGIIWGIWHWPIIAMGYNYGIGYFGAPWLGMLMMVWTTLGFGIFMGWLTLRAQSVWPGVIAHGAINGLASISLLVIKGSPNTLLGPLPTGLIASLPFTAASLWVLLSPKTLEDLLEKKV